MSSSAPALSVRGLGKSYTIVHNATGHVTMAEVALHRLRHPLQRAEREQFWALRDVDFDLNEGEVLGVLGRNGAGKSTLLKLLGRIAAPTAGEIALWGRVGSLLEVGTGFHPELTGRENVYLNGSILGMTTREISRQFDAIVDFAGVERFLDTPVKRYSSGMYVRLAFAVAAHLETEILLVDEVLAVGDADFQRKCLDKMHDVASTGRTVVFVSHQMRSIERLCSRVLLLEGGRIAFDGSTAEGVSRYLHQSFETVGTSVPEERPGTGEIRITDVSVPTQNVATEDPKRIQFRLEQRGDGLDRCFMAVVLRNAEGIPVAHCDSNVVGEWFSVADGAVEGEFTLATPWLHPGDYVADLYVCNAGVLDSYDNACKFTVRPGYPYAAGIEDELARRDLVPPDFGFGTLARAGTPKRATPRARPMPEAPDVRISAYVLLADLAWLTESLSSYYRVVDRLVVSHDVDRRGWNGSDLSAEIARGRELIEALDVEGKVVWLEADFVPPDHDPSAGETKQRQASLDVASAGADWVLQLDSDEVVPDLDHFVGQVAAADRAGVDGLEYSGRWLQTHARGRWFTETCTRRGGFWDGIPGPVAVRAGTPLHYHRQIEGRSWRVAVARADADERMRPDQALLHFSMVRTPGAVNWKSTSNSHSNDFDWSPKIARWNELDQRPLVGVARSLLRPLDIDNFQPSACRFVRLPARYDDELVAEQTMLGDPVSLRPPGTPGARSAPSARVLAFHLPQFHPIPENDTWWGTGFTEWTNTAKARPRYPGHYQPHLPADLGFYDLRLPESRAAQAELAREHGVEGFLYWHYWFGHGRRILERPVDEIVASGEPDFPFALAWANQTWSGIWHGAADRVLMEQQYPGPDDERAHFEHILPALTDPRYLTVDGKPMFYVFRPEQLPDAAGFVERWRGLAAEAGLPGLYLLAESSDLLGAGPVYTDALAHGFDAAVYMRLPADTRSAAMLGARVARKARVAEVFPYRAEPLPVPDDPRLGRTYSTVYPNWDNSPRSGPRAVVLHGATPERFRAHLRAAIDRVADLPLEERLVFVKSWNEWAEGNHLEPDRRHGRGFLEVVRDEVARSLDGTSPS